MPKKPIKTKTTQKLIFNNALIAIILGTLVLLYLIILAFPFTRGAAQYPIAFVRCGGQPVISYGLYEKHYARPGDAFYRRGFGFTFEKYFCSENEAKNAGYSLDEV